MAETLLLTARHLEASCHQTDSSQSFLGFFLILARNFQRVFLKFQTLLPADSYQ